MASFNQDFRKFQKDTFEIVFTITDATTSIASYYAWWGVYSAVPTDWNGGQQNTPILQKSSTPAFNTGPSAGGIVMGVSTVTISIQQSDFNGDGDTGVLDEAEWYHELVIGVSADGSDSVVAAIGTMTISPSLFTNNLYRW